jgi:hypothetical protein
MSIKVNGHKTDACILAYGNVSDGFGFIGPFATPNEAIEYAQDSRLDKDGSWHTVPLDKPVYDEAS